MWTKQFYVNGHYCCAFQQGYKIFWGGQLGHMETECAVDGAQHGCRIARFKWETQALRERRYRRVALIQRADWLQLVLWHALVEHRLHLQWYLTIKIMGMRWLTQKTIQARRFSMTMEKRGYGTPPDTCPKQQYLVYLVADREGASG